jgi:phenylalanyl-tRNA synthetase beta chain
MKISLNWLKDYVSGLPEPTKIADLLTSSGLEVEEIESIGQSYDGVVVGRVLDVRKHPNADRLTLCSVDVANEEPLQIVCGAPNVAADQLVPVATVGTTLQLPPRSPGEAPEPLTLSRRKVRGEYSEGMICAEDELGLSDDHEGIMVLDDDATVGRPFAEYLQARGIPLADQILDVAITPNRPDATSHFGVARDVAALIDKAFVKPEVQLDAAGRSDDIDITIESPEACPRYVGVVVRGATIGESPEWLKRRLTSVGLRPRNNVVDVTNFVMFECGQPLHAFDLKTLAGPAIRVRLSEREESFTTLDDIERMLPEGTLLICDAERPVAIAGVMGGANSEVTDATSDVLIESAYFDPSTVRRTAKALGLQTDSSYRFERGVDRDGQAWTAARAAELIVRLAGGTIEHVNDVHPVEIEQPVITVRLERVATVLGVEIPRERIVRDLRAIGFEVTEDGDTLSCIVPTFRPDVEREIDVIEEIARLFGYDNIPAPRRTSIPNVTPRVRKEEVVLRSIQSRLSSLGLREVHTNSMLPRETAARFLEAPLAPADDWSPVETLNPISREMATLRPSLLPGALQVMAHNHNHGQKRLAFFETGHVFGKTDRTDTLVPGYDERDHVIVAVGGIAEAPGWNAAERPFDVYDVKGIVEHLLESLGIDDVSFDSGRVDSGLTSYHATISIGGERIGLIAGLSDGIRNGYDLPGVFFAELDMNRLVEAAAVERAYAPVSRHPVVERDIAIVLSDGVPSGSIERTIRERGGELLKDVRLFDMYAGEHIDAGRKSLAFSLVFGADRTLRDREVDDQVAAIVKALQEEHGAELRQ